MCNHSSQMCWVCMMCTCGAGDKPSAGNQVHDCKGSSLHGCHMHVSIAAKGECSGGLSGSSQVRNSLSAGPCGKQKEDLCYDNATYLLTTSVYIRCKNDRAVFQKPALL